MFNSSIRVDPGPRNRGPTSLLALKVFISSICVDPGPRSRGPTSLLALKIRTPVANTGKIRSIGQVPVLFQTATLEEFCYVYETPEMLSLIVIHL